MYFAGRDFNESVLYGGQTKERRNRSNLDFPYALAKRFEFLLFSIFVLDARRKKIEICYTIDDNRQAWEAEHLLGNEIDTFSQVKANSCTPLHTTPRSCIAPQQHRMVCRALQPLKPTVRLFSWSNWEWVCSSILPPTFQSAFQTVFSKVLLLMRMTSSAASRLMPRISFTGGTALN